MEAAFRHFGGRSAGGAVGQRAGAGGGPRRRRRARCGSTRGCLAFARYWGFRPRACAPYRARTKGKDERGVGYVKRNAIAGHGFDSWAALEAHLDAVDARDRRSCACHGTTERGADRVGSSATRRRRCVRSTAVRRSTRCANWCGGSSSECTIELDTNSYSVPWRLIGETRCGAVASGGRVAIRHDGARGRQPCRDRRPAAAGDRSGALSMDARRPGAADVRRASRRPQPVPARRRCCGRWRSTSRRSGEAGDDPDQATLAGWLTRLQLTAIRDQLDSLLDEARGAS